MIEHVLLGMFLALSFGFIGFCVVRGIMVILK